MFHVCLLMEGNRIGLGWGRKENGGSERRNGMKRGRKVGGGREDGGQKKKAQNNWQRLKVEINTYLYTKS